MKTIFTLLLSSFFTVASFAADRRPVVTVNGSRSYEVVIDGRSYFGSNGNTISLANLRNGQHNIQVFEVYRGIFRKKSRLVSSSNFRLWDNDIYINVDRFGNVQIKEARFGRDGKYGRDNDWDNDHRNDNGWKRDNDDRNDRDQNRRY